MLLATCGWNKRDTFVCTFLVEMCMCKCGSKWQCNVLEISAMLLFGFFHSRPLQSFGPTCLVSWIRVVIYLLLLCVCVRLRTHEYYNIFTSVRAVPVALYPDFSYWLQLVSVSCYCRTQTLSQIYTCSECNGFHTRKLYTNIRIDIEIWHAYYSSIAIYKK